MSTFDFEELVAEMLNLTDEQREDYSAVEDALYEKFGIDMEQGYEFTKALLPHTPKVEAGLSGKTYHAFVSKDMPVMLMKMEAK